MSATVVKPNAGYRLSQTELRRRWIALADDPLVAAIPFKVELNEKGAIEVSPPTVRHGVVQAFIARELARQRPEGTTIIESPVETESGVRVPDVVWASPTFMQRYGAESALRAAPELCVEVLLPTNTPAEIGEKVDSYLTAGAREVWVVGDDGVPEIRTGGGRAAASELGFELPRLGSR